MLKNVVDGIIEEYYGRISLVLKGIFQRDGEETAKKSRKDR